MRFVTEHDPPEGRARKCEGPKELVLTEPAVMLAVAQWMFQRGAVRVCIYPDGQHVKQFDIARWLKCQGFRKEEGQGKTKVWVCDGRTLKVRFESGKGDVVADVDGKRIFVETKGGCINSRHSGRLSQLRERLYEAVGSLFVAPEKTRRLVAVPRHRVTEKLADRMADRCRKAGIQVMLVSSNGDIELVPDERCALRRPVDDAHGPCRQARQDYGRK